MKDGGTRILSEEIRLAAAERPDTSTLLTYWCAKAGRRMAPPWREIDLMALPPGLVPRIIVVDVDQGRRRYRFRFFGTWHVERNPADLTGREVGDHIDPVYREAILRQYDTVVGRRSPALFRFGVEKGDRRLVSEILRLPLSNDGKTVSAVLSGESTVEDGLPAYRVAAALSAASRSPRPV